MAKSFQYYRGMKYFRTEKPSGMNTDLRFIPGFSFATNVYNRNIYSLNFLLFLCLKQMKNSNKQMRPPFVSQIKQRESIKHCNLMRFYQELATRSHIPS